MSSPRTRKLTARHTPETEAYGISSFTYRTSQPFDASKLWAFFHDQDNWRSVLRSKGFFWVEADPRVAYEWAQAGGISNLSPAGMWWAAVPRDRWGHPDGERPDQQPSWHPRFGDRAQQLVFIGLGMNEPELRRRLDACLLDEALAEGDSAAWTNRANPFPKLHAESNPARHAT